jgi:hypothetical protein
MSWHRDNSIERYVQWWTMNSKISNRGPQGCWYVLSPSELKKQLKGRHVSSDAEVIAAAETWLDGQPSANFCERLEKLWVWSMQFVSFLVGRRTYQHPGNWQNFCDFSSVPSWSCQDRALNLAVTASIHILTNTSLIYLPTIHRYRVRATCIIT